MRYDVIIVGGSYAGLSAGLPLARARRKVLVVDAGLRRNRFAATSHGFLTQDGSTPEEIAAEGRAQLMDYATVDWLSGEVAELAATEEGFAGKLKDGTAIAGRRVILASGVRDELPALPGLAERWGRQVFHCPYCHGYELDQGEIGVLATSALSLHHALMLPDWGPTTFFLNGEFAPDEAQRAQLAARGVKIEAGLVTELAGDAGLQVQMQDGRSIPLAGLFALSRTEQTSPLAAQLGCALEDGPMGRFIRTDEMRGTTVPGVWACGDAARQAGSVTLAVADGNMAGVAAHRSLMFGL